MRIISKREHHEEISYSLFYEERGRDGCGYSFLCDKDGKINEADMSDSAKASLAKCRLNEGNIFFSPDVNENVHRWIEPAIGQCPCGCSVALHGFTNTCDCGRDFNMSGQELASREQWGEETGESLSDILAIP